MVGRRVYGDANEGDEKHRERRDTKLHGEFLSRKTLARQDVARQCGDVCPNYLQNGQQPPEAATRVAAGAAVANTPTAAASNPRILAFITVPPGMTLVNDHSVQPQVDWKVKSTVPD